MIINLPADLSFLSIIILTCILIGFTLLHRFLKVEFESAIVQLLFSWGVGFGILSAFIFLIALARWLTQSNLIFLILLLLFFTIRSLPDIGYSLKQAFFEISETIQSKWDRIQLIIFLLAVLNSFLFNYTPATSGYELDYYLRVPRLWLENRGLGGDYDYNHKNLFYPFLIESLYSLPLAFQNTQVPKLIHACFGLFSALASFAISKHFFSKKSALLAMNIVFLMPIIVSEIGTAHSQLGSLFYALLTIYALFRWAEKDSQNLFWICIAGLMAGFCWQAKIVGLSLVPVGIFFIFMQSLFNFSSSQQLITKRLILFSFFAIVGCSPWFVKNIVFHKNPFFPVSVNFLGWKGHEYSDLEIESQKETQKNFSLWTWIRYHNNILVGKDPLFGPGPLVFAFLFPAWILCNTKSIKIGFILAITIFIFHNLIFYGYHFRFHETKYYLPFYCLLAILSAEGIESMKNLLFHRAIQTITLLGLLFPGFCASLYFGISKIPVFIGLESKEHYLRRKIPEYEIFTFANNHLPQNSRILAIPSGHSAFYFNAMIITPTLKLIRESEPSKIIHQLKNDKITHILLMRNYPTIKSTYQMTKHPQFDLRLRWDLELLTKTNLKKLYSNNHWSLYSIDYSD